jgi:O-antigen biosynthesis protein WbqP
MYRDFVKPAIDVTLAAIGLIAISPILLLTALAILIEDGQPIFFVHQRVGKDGVAFRIFKFRSMEKNSSLLPSSEGAKLKVTRVGSIIRRLNIDELPQLLNVLRQDMSLIGPRPGLVAQTDLHASRRANGSIRLRPGITGLAQVNGFDDMSTEEKAALDGRYQQELSLWIDIKVILATFRYLTRRPPTY